VLKRGEKDYWYIAAESRELRQGQALSRQILDEWLVLFRGENGDVTALRDRCVHRAGRLSKGAVKDGRLICNYHGWHYNSEGSVVRVPADSPNDVVTRRCAKKYAVVEQDDFIYVCLETPLLEAPFKMPSYREKGYHTIRLQHVFDNTVTNCAENFIDIPHTTYVHPGIFRYDIRQKLSAKVQRENGVVRCEYGFETNNFGFFSKILNPSGKEIRHIDEFHMPNVTSVHYHFGGGWHFIITSQTVPISNDRSLVYTDLTYNYGWVTYLAAPIVRWQAKKIIEQDVVILRQQMEVIKKYGAEFQNARADVIHTFIESVRDEIGEGRDPRLLPKKSAEIEFWI
jgi:phenylpropionate dioxygenase-like ring-hydroxylating dioxygenase large terminal subunit